MAKKTAVASETEVDSIIESLDGDVRLGEKYYFFTVTYSYIGRVSKITDEVITLDDSSLIVMSAGGANDAVSKIVQGKQKPEICENPGVKILVFRQALTCVIPCK